eukprot:21309-Heterococcus_DN1.PRE.3
MLYIDEKKKPDENKSPTTVLHEPLATTTALSTKSTEASACAHSEPAAAADYTASAAGVSPRCISHSTAHTTRRQRSQ